MSPPVELRVAGVRFTNWTDLRVSASIETACRSFELSAFRTGKGESRTPPVPLDASCEVWLGGRKVVTGVVGRVQRTRSDRRSGLSVSGRSKTREIVDCSVQGKQRWSGLTVGQIAAEVCAPYRVTVRDVAGDRSPVGHLAAERRGETVFSLLERAARVRSLLLTDDAEGNLVLTRVGITRAGTVDGTRALEADLTSDSEQRYATIVCHGVRTGDDRDFGASLFAEESAEDDGPLRRRLLVVQPEGRADPASCLARAQWEVATRYGKSVTLRYTVPGWTREDGALWEPNVLTRVIDRAEGVDATFLLVSVTFRLGPRDFRTELELAPPEGFKPMPVAVRKLRTRGKDKALGIQDVETIPTTVGQAYDVRQGSGRVGP